MLNDAIKAVQRFTEALNLLSIDYYIGGSMASIVYGKARTTRDVDFVITVQAEDAERLVAAAGDLFYIDRVAVERSIRTGDCFNALELETVFQVDVFTPAASAWRDIQFSRRRWARLGPGGESGVDVYLASPEDVVINKLEWFQIGNEVSRLQWEDALGILSVQKGRLDQEHLSRWAAELGLSELLSRAMLAAYERG